MYIEMFTHRMAHISVSFITIKSKLIRNTYTNHVEII
jgi:hypothetical protein